MMYAQVFISISRNLNIIFTTVFRASKQQRLSILLILQELSLEKDIQKQRCFQRGEVDLSKLLNCPIY
jgi:hypothetical protein